MLHFNKFTALLSFLLLLYSTTFATTIPDTILIDFGNTLSPAPWNNLTNARTGEIADLITSKGFSSGVGIAVIDSFNNINLNGTTTPDSALQLPSTATDDSFFGNVTPFGGQTQPTGGIVLTGLSPTTSYRFEIFASRMGVSDNREAAYVITGSSVDTIYLDASNNDSLVATLEGMLPASDSTITVIVGPGPNNTNGSGFYYLGAIRMAYVLSQIDTVLIDFGNVPTPGGWNNVSDPIAGTIPDMINSVGLNSGISIEVDDRFNNINTNGTTTPKPGIPFPGTATGDSFFGNTATFGGQIQETGGIRLSGLDPAIGYSFLITASRMGVADNRETQYTLIGQDSMITALNSSNNDSLVATITDLFPDSNGVIRLIAEPGPNNTNGTGFYYLGALRMTYSAPVSEPQQETLTLLSPQGGERWETGKEVAIRWASTNVLSAALAYSTDNGQTWTEIDTVPGFQSPYMWTVPEDTSSFSLIRITTSQLTVVNDEPFTIAEDNGTDCLIVVLGSSTSAGTGASTPDSAWVNRYRNHLYQRDTDFMVTNLAQGGFTTYNILPTGTPIPTGVNQMINQLRNITRALSFHPDAIIINMPSNDAANSYPVADQLANYDLILAAADTIPVWVTTPQPRDFGGDSVRVQIQLDLLDSTYARFQDFAIDFWTDIANSSNEPDSAYDSGDGIHLNDAGHKILFERVIGAAIDQYLKDSKQGTSSISRDLDLFGEFSLYPNPMTQQAQIRFVLPQAAFVDLVMMDLHGREVSQLAQSVMPAGEHLLSWDRGSLPTGLYLCQIRSRREGLLHVETIRVVVGD